MKNVLVTKIAGKCYFQIIGLIALGLLMVTTGTSCKKTDSENIYCDTVAKYNTDYIFGIGMVYTLAPDTITPKLIEKDIQDCAVQKIGISIEPVFGRQTHVTMKNLTEKIDATFKKSKKVVRGKDYVIKCDIIDRVDSVILVKYGYVVEANHVNP